MGRQKVRIDQLVVPPGTPDGHRPAVVLGELAYEAPGAGGGAVAVEDEGVEVVASASRLNFTGAGVTATDAGSGEVTVTIPGGGGGGGSSIRNVDEPTDSSWGTASAYDAEFDTDGTSLPSGWSWVNQGTSTWEQRFGAGVIRVPTSSTDNLRMVVRSIPTAATWTATAKLVATSKLAGNTPIGLVLRDSVSGKLICANRIVSGTAARYDGVEFTRWNSPTSFLSAITAAAEWSNPLTYFRLRKTAATTYAFDVSADGVAWETVNAGTDISSHVTPDQIGFFVGCNNSRVIEGAAHFFRVR